MELDVFLREVGQWAYEFGPVRDMVLDEVDHSNEFSYVSDGVLGYNVKNCLHSQMLRFVSILP